MRRVPFDYSHFSWIDGILDRVFRRFAVLLLIFDFGGNWVLNAAGVQAVPIEILAVQANWIVHARVLSLESRHSASFGITTAVELEVLETWKGIATNRMVLSVAGGVLGDRRMVVTGQPEFRVDEEAILFLVINDRGEGVLLELSQGKFEVRRNSDKQAFVSNNVYGAPTQPTSTSRQPRTDNTTSSPTSIVSQAKVVPPHQLPLTLTELKRRVLASLSP